MRRGAEPESKGQTVAPVRRLRVAFVAPGMGIGGAERWVLALCRHFSAAIEVVAIFTEDRDGPLAGEAKRFAPLLPYSAVRHTAFDVLLAWGCPQLAEVVPMPLRERTVAVSHGSPELKWSQETCAGMAKAAAHLTAVSRQAVGSWPRKRQKQVTVLPNGAEIERCVPRRGREEMRRALGIGTNEKVALYLGRLAPEKRPWIMGRMADYLPDDWRVIVCGPITTQWWGEWDHNPQVWGPKVTLLPPVDHPGDLLAAADVFVLPSETEGFPLALTEAWLAGIPVVCADWPTMKDLTAQHGHLAQVLPVNAPACDYAVAVERAVELTETAAHARRVAWEHYTAGAMAQRWESYLGRIAA